MTTDYNKTDGPLPTTRKQTGQNLQKTQSPLSLTGSVFESSSHVVFDPCHLYSYYSHMFIQNLVICYIIILFNAFINHIHMQSVMAGNRHNIITSYNGHITSPGIPASTVKSRRDT